MKILRTEIRPEFGALGPIIVRWLLMAAVCYITPSTAEAQVGFGGSPDSPTFSPYLNLFRGQGGSGNNTLLNYYGLVRPQNQAFAQNQQFSQNLYNLQRRSQQAGRTAQRGIPQYSQMGMTGHPTAFMTIRSGVGGGSSGAGFGAFGGRGNIGSAFGGGSIGGGNLGTAGLGSIGGGSGFGQSAFSGGGFRGSGGLGGFGVQSGGLGGGFGGSGGFGGYGIGTATGHGAAFSAGVGSAGAGFGN